MAPPRGVPRGKRPGSRRFATSSPSTRGCSRSQSCGRDRRGDARGLVRVRRPSLLGGDRRLRDTKSDPLELVAVGVHRAVGTIAGAAVAVELVRHVDSRPWLTAALVVASALGIAFSKANYAIFTFFMTAVLILSTQLVRGDAARAAGQRIWATLLGVLLAFVVTSLVLLVARRRTQAPRTRPDPGHP
jgi:hypothetical protein